MRFPIKNPICLSQRDETEEGTNNEPIEESMTFLSPSTVLTAPTKLESTIQKRYPSEASSRLSQLKKARLPPKQTNEFVVINLGADFRPLKSVMSTKEYTLQRESSFMMPKLRQEKTGNQNWQKVRK